ncbi:MAG: acetylxylan esterase, partial [Armatimonadota bacterium]
VSYYDTVNVATRCHVPTLVTAGTKDPSVRPAQAEALFDALPGRKKYELMDWGHDWHSSMVARNLAWLDEWTA